MKSHTILSHTDIIRAWKDEAFRSALTDAQRDALPDHPSGLVELGDAELDGVAGGRPRPGTGGTFDGGTCELWTFGCCYTD
jgi:mersacidin/lichenicidin family type 2 lantibiotic